jgi:hypothetical protein
MVFTNLFIRPLQQVHETEISGHGNLDLVAGALGFFEQPHTGNLHVTTPREVSSLTIYPGRARMRRISKAGGSSSVY